MDSKKACFYSSDAEKWMREERVERDATDRIHEEKIFRAVKQRHQSVLKWFLYSGLLTAADEDPSLKNVAHHAAHVGNMSVLKWLDLVAHPLTCALDSNARDLALYAASRGQLEVLQWLHSCARLDAKRASSFDGGNVSHYAARYASPRVLDWLLSEGMLDAKAKDGYGMTMAHVCAIYSRHKRFKTLEFLHASALLDAHDRDRFGNTVGYYIASYSPLEIVQWAHAAGVLVLSKDAHGMRVRYATNGSEVYHWLYSEGPLDVKDVDSKGRTLAHLAAAFDRLETLQWLFDRGQLDTTAKDNQGRNVALVSAREGIAVQKTLSWLKSKNLFNANDTDASGKSIARYAIDRGLNKALKWMREERLLEDATLEAEIVEILDAAAERATDHDWFD